MGMASTWISCNRSKPNHVSIFAFTIWGDGTHNLRRRLTIWGDAIHNLGRRDS